MPKAVVYGRIPWADRFSRPTAEILREALKPPVRRLFDEARRRMVEIPHVREQAVWYGECWRWVLEYRTDGSDHPIGVIIPSPMDLQLAVPLDQGFLRSLATRRLKRPVRDGLDLAAEPFDTRWGVWSLLGLSMITDLQDLIQLKLTYLGKKVG